MSKSSNVKVVPLSDGLCQIKVATPQVILSDGTIPSDSEGLTTNSMLLASVTKPRLKLKAAEYFLKRLQECSNHEAAALVFLDSFVQSLRAATFALQAVCNRSTGFSEWYTTKQTEMRDNPQLAMLVKLRNEAQKVGLEFVHYEPPETCVKLHLDGRIETEELPAKLEIDGFVIDEPVETFRHWLATIGAIVEDAHTLGFVPPPVERVMKAMIRFLREQDDGSWVLFDP